MADSESKKIPVDLLTKPFRDSHGSQTLQLKLATLRTEEKGFNEATYQPVAIHEGEAEKIPSKDPEKRYENPGNVIRWRLAGGEHSSEDIDIPSTELGTYMAKNQDIESNTRIIEWSDGTYQLAVGKQLFDLRLENEHHMKVFAKLEDYLISKGEIDKKVILVPAAGSTGYAMENYLKLAKPEAKKKKKKISGKALEEGAEVQRKEEDGGSNLSSFESDSDNKE